MQLLSPGFQQVAFEVGDSVRRQWTCTLASTRLQSPVAGCSCSDFLWPETHDAFPWHDQVVGYLAARLASMSVRLRITVVAVKYVELGRRTWLTGQSAEHNG